MKKRLLSVILLCALLTSALASCGGTTPADETTAPTGETTAPVEEDSPFEKDSLPADLDFGGESIRVLYRDDVLNAFYVGEQTGDIVDDAVYRANRAVEERLNVKFEITTQAGSANADRTTYMATITNSVLAGDDVYDMSGVLTYNVPTLIQNGVLLDLTNVKYLDLDKPWWVQDLKELASVGNRLYFVSGDICLELTQRIYCMLFNKELADTLKVGDVYGLVRDGNWTLSKMEELGKVAYSDLNGNAAVDVEDRYGVVINDNNHGAGFLASCNMTLTTPDADGFQRMDYGTEHDIEVIQKIVPIFNNNDGFFYSKKTDSAGNTLEQEPYYEMFKDNRLLFTAAELNQVCTVYRDMQAEFGVIPFPKWDEAQDQYYTLARNVYSSFVILQTCKKTDAVGAVMEALASENYRSTSPTYFETALKVKYSRDDDTSQMYDLIKSGLKFNFGFTFSVFTSNMANKFQDMITNNDVNWASKYAAFKDTADASLQKFYDTVLSFE